MLSRALQLTVRFHPYIMMAIIILGANDPDCLLR